MGKLPNARKLLNNEKISRSGSAAIYSKNIDGFINSIDSFSGTDY